MFRTCFPLLLVSTSSLDVWCFLLGRLYDDTCRKYLTNWMKDFMHLLRDACSACGLAGERFSYRYRNRLKDLLMA